MTAPLIQLDHLERSFQTGEVEVRVLKGISLTVEEGEFLAIMGASGSGKSTLMNLIGGLDYPSGGSYYFKGREIANYSQEELAKLRREHFGFIFQRYHLLNTLTAKGNVEMPAIYSGVSAGDRDRRARDLLKALGLGDRVDYYPTQLSGGQQQRVSIARALMNGGEIILADEPTGALDSASGKAVLEILKELNAKGHTVIMVTHDPDVAAHAKRVIELKDGLVIRDTKQAPPPVSSNHIDLHEEAEPKKVGLYGQLLQRISNAFKMAVISMAMQRMRTFLTMLGIIIGIASVVLVIALGRGTTDRILENINAMGTSTLTVFPGSGFGDRRSGRIQSLRPSDVAVLEKQSFIHSVTPVVSHSVSVRYHNITAVNVSLQGVGFQYFDVEGYDITQGVGFDRESEDELKLEAVIDENTVETLFPNGENPIGEVIMLDHLPVQVIGVATSKSTGMRGSNNMNVWVPYSTLMKRMLGQNFLRNITIRVDEDVNLKLAEKSITDILTVLHGKKDFFIFNADTIRETIEETTMTMRILVTSIALISLLVGGIGVMNIMLVSVAERTREIGMRMAVGARQSDVSQQFLIEAVLVCLLGGVLGLSLALGLGFIMGQVNTDFPLRFSMSSIILAFFASFLIGIIFGYFPAKRASELAPIEALERS
ncbi:MacB family efflux pump subunit [Ignatzschineria sp. RMDPL8A]|uniref:MacB family efflux pump subunit n=1 Tax=Ignatzschineria sp. RMDPL8A TaxID=2999236 RepID=UPI001690F68A|nr:MacB family efflux pump subunit [Ignatzschineria sp. RMDPL8A]MDG9730198.1 MacB family efflux pump subunit [Ignatzschineria sp. RMDPL8A]NLD09251.1 MacB family efflux pump subunit [Xanthomonadaceae bacterium]